MADQLTYNDIPGAISFLLKENLEIKRLLHDVLQSTSRLNGSNSKEVMNVKQAAVFLSRSESGIYGLINKRKIPFSKVDGSITFLRCDLIEWIKSGRQNTESEAIDETRKRVVALNK